MATQVTMQAFRFALEGQLTEELLRQDIGIVVGFVLNQPEVFKAQNGGN